MYANGKIVWNKRFERVETTIAIVSVMAVTIFLVVSDRGEKLQ